MEIADDCDIGSQQYVLIIYSFKQNYLALQNPFHNNAQGWYYNVRVVLEMKLEMKLTRRKRTRDQIEIGGLAKLQKICKDPRTVWLWFQWA